MADSEYTPNLTLNPTQAVAQEAPAAPQITLQTEQTKPTAEPEKLDIERLTPAEQAAVREFAKQIDVKDTNLVLSYGAAAQKNISEFSGQALSKVRTKDMGEVGDKLASLVVELKGLNEDEKAKGIKGLFKKAEKNIAATKAKFDKAEVNVDKITGQLQQHQVTLSQDITAMDKMFELNQAYFKELTMYIIAGKLRAQELRENDLVELQKRAEQSGLPEDAQAANDFANLIGRFEKKIHDLELTRTISLQMGPQIRMIQNNDLLMTEKIQTAIVNTIPLWKQQMVLALSMYHSQQAMEASHAVSEVTNDLLLHNAEALHTGSVEVAKESERGIVDLETLKKTNQHLIDTLEEVRKIQDDGRARRAEAELELGRIEGELKQKLLEMKG
ncbi:MAG: toxic anion resistance protein [Oscillospiraceae bacterium]|nr:toxic anion resistance protein [Oscillospiraceae bacterium]